MGVGRGSGRTAGGARKEGSECARKPQPRAAAKSHSRSHSHSAGHSAGHGGRWRGRAGRCERGRGHCGPCGCTCRVAARRPSARSRAPSSAISRCASAAAPSGRAATWICVAGAWQVRGRCVGGAWEARWRRAGRACGGARALRDGQQGLCMVSGAAAHMTERVSMPELSAQAVLLKVWRG